MTATKMTQINSLAKTEINDADSASFNMRELCKVLDSAERQWLFNIYDSAHAILNIYIDKYGAINLND